MKYGMLTDESPTFLHMLRKICQVISGDIFELSEDCSWLISSEISAIFATVNLSILTFSFSVF